MMLSIIIRNAYFTKKFNIFSIIFLANENVHIREKIVKNDGTSAAFKCHPNSLPAQFDLNRACTVLNGFSAFPMQLPMHFEFVHTPH